MIILEGGWPPSRRGLREAVGARTSRNHSGQERRELASIEIVFVWRLRAELRGGYEGSLFAYRLCQFRCEWYGISLISSMARIKLIDERRLGNVAISVNATSPKCGEVPKGRRGCQAGTSRNWLKRYTSRVRQPAHMRLTDEKYSENVTLSGNAWGLYNNYTTY